MLVLPVLLAATTATAQVDPRPTNRTAFYDTAQFGDLALVVDAPNLDVARTRRNYMTFGDTRACYELPPLNYYYFAINNRNRSGVTTRNWASLLTVVYERPDQPDLIHLYRNDGWRSRAGQPLRPYNRTSVDLGLTPDKFIQMHDWPDRASGERALLDFERRANGFHGRTTATDSWVSYRRVARPLRQRNRHIEAIYVHLWQYPVTADRPWPPEVVMVPRYGSSRFRIIVETEALGGPISPVQYTFATSAENCRLR